MIIHENYYFHVSKWFILGAIVGAALVALGTYFQPFYWLFNALF